jgi:hypothetical protein
MVKNQALVTVTGWLNDVKDFDWGRALKVSVDVRKQNHQGEWETVDKTIYDVTTDNRAPLDGVKQVVVTGPTGSRRVGECHLVAGCIFDGQVPGDYSDHQE